MVKNLSIRWKISLGFGIILALLAVASIVAITAVSRISGNASFVKDTAFRQALYLIEAENLVSQISAQIAASVDTGTNEGLVKAEKIKGDLDRKWAEADTVLAKDKRLLDAFHNVREKVNGQFKRGQELVQLTVNQDWASIGAATQEYNKSRDEVSTLIAGLKKDGVDQLDASLIEIAALSSNTLMIVSLVLLVALLAGIGLAYYIGSEIVMPIRRLTEAATAMAGGELTREVAIEGNDEVGVLARAFNHMTASLKEMLVQTNVTFRSLEGVSDNLSHIAAGMAAGSSQTARAIENAYLHVADMNRTVQDVAANMENFSATTEEISSWMLQMTSSVSELAKNAEVLASSVDDTTSSIHEMSASIDAIVQNVSSLLELQTTSSSSIMEINSSIKEVEDMTRRSASLAERVSSIVAEKGMNSVSDAVKGIHTLNDMVNRSSDLMQRLGGNIENIGRIVSVIDDIADQTKLLSLNAAILAAQAGEHGKGFTVVSEEINNLSENTIRSTKEISDLIHTITSESKNAVEVMAAGSKTAQSGVSLVGNVDTVLKEIHSAAASSNEIAKQISFSSGEQTRSSSFIIESIQDVTSMCKNIHKAAAEQGSGVRLMVDAAEKMKDISIVLRRTTGEQLAGSSRVAQAIDESVTKSKTILDAIQKSNRDNEQLVHAMGEIQLFTKSNLDAVLQMNDTVTVLSQQSKLLKEELNKFRF